MNLKPYLDKLKYRAEGFRSLFEALNRKLTHDRRLILVETGCIRKVNAWDSDGNSSLLFDAFAGETGSTFITIDIEPGHCRLAQQTCPHTTVLCGDSVARLHGLRESLSQVDLLYLDSLDLDWKAPHTSALHHLKELCAAMPLLTPGSIVFVDDNVNGIGKGMYVREFMKQIGADTLYEGYQVGFKLREDPRAHQ